MELALIPQLKTACARLGPSRPSRERKRLFSWEGSSKESRSERGVDGKQLNDLKGLKSAPRGEKGRTVKVKLSKVH